MKISQTHPAIRTLAPSYLEMLSKEPLVVEGAHTRCKIKELLLHIKDNLPNHKIIYISRNASEKASTINIDKFIGRIGWWPSFSNRYTMTLINENFMCQCGIFDFGICGLIWDLKKFQTFGTFIANSSDSRFLISAPSFRDEDLNIAKQFIKNIFFIELAEIKTVETSPKNRKYKKFTDKLLNDTNSKILVVDAGWDTVIKSGSFNVSGHMREQAYGPGLLKRKLIWIDEFTKEGYTRKAGKEVFQNS